jgi:hypothetical protein
MIGRTINTTQKVFNQINTLQIVYLVNEVTIFPFMKYRNILGVLSREAIIVKLAKTYNPRGSILMWYTNTTRKHVSHISEMSYPEKGTLYIYTRIARCIAA